jgi:hypothetical protein
LLRELSALTPDRFDERLAEMARGNRDIECLFILDGKGVQATDTVWNPSQAVKPNGLFRPARKGADHSLKDYYYLLIDAFISRYRTEPYISQASGHDNHVLCVDVPIS